MRTGRADTRLKVMHVGYDYNPWEVGRGGVIVYQWAIMKALARAGYDVSFYMGSRHTISNTLKIMTYTREGVRVTEMINSPRRHLDFDCNPLDHLVNGTIDKMTGEVLDGERPDIIHIHDPRLFTASIIDVIKRKNIPVIKTVHNYFDLCPQSELMFKGQWLCTDYEDGGKCRECMSSLPTEDPLKERISNTLRGTFVHPVLKRLWRAFKKRKNGAGGNNAKQNNLLPYPAESYRERRQFLIERLHMLDMIHCYSTRSADILADYGIAKEKISVIPISSDSLTGIRRERAKSGGEPVVFGYLTGASPIKGYDVLLDSFSKLDQRRAKLSAYGFDEAGSFREKYSSLNAEFYGAYSTKQLNEILSGIDVGVVPSVWEEVFGIVGIEFLSAGVPVIGSNIGGIPEWLKDRQNGLLVRAGDREDLARKMNMFIDHQELRSQMRKNITPWKSMDDHVKEIMRLYEQLL